MKTLRGISFQLFRANRLIILTSIISIMIATILVVTMVLYSLNAKESMEQSFRTLYGYADLSVGYDTGETKFLNQSLIQEIESQNGIEDAAEVAISHLTIDQKGLELYTLGVTNNDLTKSRFKFNEDLDESSVILNEGLAATFDYNVGDNLSIEGKSYRVIEIIEDIKGTSNVPDLLIMHQDNVKPFLRNGEEATYVMIKGEENQASLDMADSIKQIDPDFRIDVFEEDPLVSSNIKTLNVFIVILSALILTVTSLLVISNFDIILYKLKNQMAILRSIGATTKQVSRIIFFQSFVINTIGVGLGTIFAILGVQQIFHFAEEALNLPPTTEKINMILVILIALICFIVFQLFMLIPAYRSTKILPLKLIQENERQGFILEKSRTRLIKVLSIIAGIFALIGYVLSHKNEFFILFVLIGISLFLICLLFLLPNIITLCIKMMLPIIDKIFGKESFIAINNLLPQVRKNTLAIISISTLLVIAIFGTTILNTIQKNSETFLLDQYETPIVIENRLIESSRWIR
ncbi:ABC transporter permease [Virgibacillus pantothenticus]|uniref:ABC transporter permease n=1 Tax=Virgibacillus pantothenticus TaxID=1473 RepID=UPI0009844533|nr:ABC transporter permease [Virgibacillus pantothenticus]